MHTVDLAIACAGAVVIVALAAVLARQNYLLRIAGGFPLALRVRDNRWVYGIARYAGGQLLWYRGIGIGTGPTKVLQRGEVRVMSHRSPRPAELMSLPAAAIIVHCRDGDGTATLGFSDGGYTGFASWLEASAPS